MTNQGADRTDEGEHEEAISLLSKVPGGPELLAWLSGVPNFGDGEVVCLVLDREGQSRLSLRLDRPGKRATVTFTFRDWIDVAIRGFSNQNVIGGLRLRLAGARKTELWEQGVGCTPGDMEIELEPCFGAYGTIRATIASITIASLPPNAGF